MDLIKCPIYFETTDNMIIFNHHFYDRDSFDQHRHNEMIRNRRMMSSGYPDNIHNNCFKDPRTGANYNPTYALRTLLKSRLDRNAIRDTLLHRIEHLSSDNVDEFLPTNSDDIFQSFVSLTKELANSRLENRRRYMSHLADAANRAASSPNCPPRR